MSACGRDASRAYQPMRGPHEVEIVNPVTLAFPDLDKQLPLRIGYPAEEGRYPLIVFSHGGRLSKDDYADITDHWVSHGYIVIQPTHMDSASLGFSIKAAGARGSRRDVALGLPPRGHHATRGTAGGVGRAAAGCVASRRRRGGGHRRGRALGT